MTTTTTDATQPQNACGRYLGYHKGRPSYCQGGRLCVTCRSKLEAWAKRVREGRA